MEQHTLRYQARPSLPGSFRSGQTLKLEVIAACASLDLSAHITITDDRDEGEDLAVGSKIKLTKIHQACMRCSVQGPICHR